jgi:hypothetical protein
MDRRSVREELVKDHFQSWDYSEILNLLVSEGCDYKDASSCDKKGLIHLATIYYKNGENLPTKEIKYVSNSGVKYYTLKPSRIMNDLSATNAFPPLSSHPRPRSLMHIQSLKRRCNEDQTSFRVADIEAGDSLGEKDVASPLEESDVEVVNLAFKSETQRSDNSLFNEWVRFRKNTFLIIFVNKHAALKCSTTLSPMHERVSVCMHIDFIFMEHSLC